MRGRWNRPTSSFPVALLLLLVLTRCVPAILCHRPDQLTNFGVDARPPRIASLGNLRPVSPESIPMPPSNGVGLDDDKKTRPPWPRLTECHPEGSIDVLKRWSRALLLQRRHLLSQSEVFQYELGSAPTHRPDSTTADGDDEDENLEHRGGVCPFGGGTSTVKQVYPRAGTST